MRARVAALLLAISLLASVAVSADIGLRAACAPVGLEVEKLDPEDVLRTGLTKRAIVNAAESRLRAARLFDPPMGHDPDDPYQYLYINVTIVGSAFGIAVELLRLLDLGYGGRGAASVWKTGSVGTHNGNGQYILSGVSRRLDKFIDAYLRVNEAACKER